MFKKVFSMIFPLTVIRLKGIFNESEGLYGERERERGKRGSTSRMRLQNKRQRPDNSFCLRLRIYG